MGKDGCTGSGEKGSNDHTREAKLPDGCKKTRKDAKEKPVHLRTD